MEQLDLLVTQEDATRSGKVTKADGPVQVGPGPVSTQLAELPGETFEDIFTRDTPDE